MILVRDIFNLKFGKAKEAKAVLNEGRSLMNKFGFGKTRAMTDLTGPSYTLIMESEWKSFADWENSIKSGFASDEWQKWYQKFVPLCDKGSREIFTIFE
jgi:hypothetical protein